MARLTAQRRDHCDIRSLAQERPSPDVLGVAVSNGIGISPRPKLANHWLNRERSAGLRRADRDSSALVSPGAFSLSLRQRLALASIRLAEAYVSSSV